MTENVKRHQEKTILRTIHVYHVKDYTLYCTALSAFLQKETVFQKKIYKFTSQFKNNISQGKNVFQKWSKKFFKQLFSKQTIQELNI